MHKRIHSLLDHLTPVEFESQIPQDVLRALKEGEVEAAIVDAVSAYQFIAAEGGVQVVGDPLTDELYVIAVRLERPLLLKAVNEALVELREDGTLERLQEKWFR